MKNIYLSLITFVAATASLPAFAADVMVASTMQRCTTNEECALVTNSCADNCGFVPVNKTNLSAVQTLYQTRCGKPMDANPQCKMNPPIAAACVNARCTIDYAYANHAGAKDYKPGAYPVPEAPVPSKVQGDYQGVDDRDGAFTAYNLPQEAVKQNTVGQIVDRVYVPPSAPVSGGNYVPIGSVPQAPMTAPQAAPGQQPLSPAVPPVAVPRATSNATPTLTTQGAPVYPPVPAPATTQPGAYVPAPTQPTVPAPGLPRPPTAQAMPSPAPVPAVGAPGVPQAPPGSTPIPPSDLQPAPTFVPPPGTAVPANPGDPGAPPQDGAAIMMKMPDGTMAAMTPPSNAPPPPAIAGVKSFSRADVKSKTYN